MPSHTLKQIKVSANLPALKLNRHLIGFFKCFCIFIIHLKNFESTPKRSLSMGLNFLPKTRLQLDNRLSRHQACRKARWKPQIFLFLSAFPRKNKECDSLTIKLTVIIRPCAFIAWFFLKPYLTQIKCFSLEQVSQSHSGLRGLSANDTVTAACHGVKPSLWSCITAALCVPAPPFLLPAQQYCSAPSLRQNGVRASSHPHRREMLHSSGSRCTWAEILPQGPKNAWQSIKKKHFIAWVEKNTNDRADENPS